MKREKHGMTNTAEYHAWEHIKARCFNPNCDKYKNYGARGITMCEEWKNSFIKFIDYVGMRPTKKHSIDRIDNNGNYEPGNVKWATMKEQSLNKTNNNIITFNGESKTITEWAKEKNIHVRTLSNRISRGWNIDKALNTPSKKYKY